MKRLSRFSRAFPGLIGVTMLCLLLSRNTFANESDSTETLEATVEVLCDEIFQSFEQYNSIVVKAVEGPPNVAGNPGTAIATMLESGLRRRKFEIRKVTAALAVQGKYFILSSAEGFLFIRIQLEILDGDTGMPLKGVARETTLRQDFSPIKDSRTPPRHAADDPDGVKRLAVLLAPTVEYDPAESMAERHKKLDQARRNPSYHAAGENRSQVASRQDSLYRVEILVNGMPVPVTNQEGMAFLQLARGDVYEIRLINNSEYDAAVQIHIDGLSVFQFSTHPEYRHFLIPKKSSGIVQGWHVTNTVAHSFLVTSYPDSAAAREVAQKDATAQLEAKAKRGVITVTFAAAWEGGIENAPPDEKLLREKANRGDPLGTGIGPDIKVHLKPVTRTIGVARSTVSIRYDRRQD